jgi:hypothetical protein
VERIEAILIVREKLSFAPSELGHFLRVTDGLRRGAVFFRDSRLRLAASDAALTRRSSTKTLFA